MSSSILHISNYSSPIGELLIAVKNNKLVGLWIQNQKYYLSNYTGEMIMDDDNLMIVKTKQWLDRYFNGEKVSPNELKLAPEGSEFRLAVLRIIVSIPYGEVITYRDIAEKLGKKSYQAVGAAVGHNPISIIIPCHRVVGVNGKLTGYAAGIDKKIKLLEIEGVSVTSNSVEENVSL